ncbi:unnamed protein product [Allacma fusca]|uniref:Uncharacterized protein n=1 Tax=Allacma fusca TaxID=39272 RepID=A0A8J2KSX1_9HEXA|nr:unnamed protein product [Allacma fusca]
MGPASPDSAGDDSAGDDSTGGERTGDDTSGPDGSDTGGSADTTNENSYPEHPPPLSRDAPEHIDGDERGGDDPPSKEEFRQHCDFGVLTTRSDCQHSDDHYTSLPNRKTYQEKRGFKLGQQYVMVCII